MNLPEIQLEDDTHIYNFTLGKIYRKFKNGSIKETGCKDKDGYNRITIEGKKSRIHRFLYEKYHGMKIPIDRFIDHIDRDRGNNCIDNLRLVTKRENNQNITLPKHNTSGFKNIRWHKQHNCWYVTIHKDKQYLYQKLFKDLDEAILARNTEIDRLNLLGHKFSKV